MIDMDMYSFKVGNVVEAEPLCGNLCGENVLLQVTEKKRTSILFDVTYFGVLLGYAVFDAAGGWSWQQVTT